MRFWIRVVVVCILAISLYAAQKLSWFNAFWSGAIVIGALGTHQYWGAGRRKVIQELRHSSRQIRQGDLKLEVDSLLAADRFFADSELLGQLWNSYKESAGSGTRIGLPDPKEVFSQRALCQRDDGSRFARLMPGALTGAGILGTFIGLVWGLYQMNLDTAEALQESIHTLTAGMQTAFITSIVGITCSLVYSYVDQSLDNQVLAAIGDFHSALSYLIPHTTEYSLLETLAVTQQQQLADFKTFASDTLVDVVVGGFRQAMAEIVAPHMQRTTDIFEDFTKGSSEIQVQGMREMADLFNASLNQAAQEQMAALANSIEDMVEWQELIRTELAALVEQLIAGAEEQRKNLAISLELAEHIQGHVPAFEALQGIFTSLSEDMSQSAVAFSDIASNVIEVHESTEAVAKKHSELEEELSRLTREVADSVYAQKEGLDASLELVYRLQNHVPVFTELQQSLAGLGADMSKSGVSLSGAVANLQELHLSIEQSVTAAREQQAELSLSQEEHKQNLRKELDVMKTLWESSVQDLRDLHQELSTGIQTFTNQLHDGLSYSIGEFDNLVTDVTTRLRVVISAMSDSVEDIPDEMNRVVDALHELRGALESAIADAELGRSGTNEEIERHIEAEAEMSQGRGS